MVRDATHRHAFRHIRSLQARDRIERRKTVLFHLGLAGQATYIAPLLQELRARRANVGLYLIVDQQLGLSNASLAELTNIAEPRILRWNDRGALDSMDAFISPTQWVTGEPNARVRICIFHGLPTKGVTFLPEMIRHFNTLFLLGPLQRSLFDEFAAAHPAIGSGLRTFNVGYTKLDGVMCGRISRHDVLMKLGLDPAEPVILYAPAYDDGTALDMYGEEVVERLLEVDANLIVKLHYMCYDPRYYPRGVNWTERLKKFETNPRFRHVGNQTLDSFLAACDVLVNDVSSSSLEFMMLDKPVVFIDCPQFFQNTLGHTEYVCTADEVLRDIRANAGRSAGLVVPDPSSLPQAVRRSLQHPGEFSPQRHAIRSQMLYNPGRAATVAADTLLDLIGDGPRRAC